MTIIDEGINIFEGVICVIRGSHAFLEKGLKIPGDYKFVGSPESADDIDLVFSDLRDSDLRLMKRLQRIAPVIALDDMGEGKDLAHLTIHSFPTLEEVEGNFKGHEYIVLGGGIGPVEPLPREERKGILVTFGGSDPFNLSERVTRVLNSLGFKPFVVKGPFFKGKIGNVDCSIIENPKSIHHLIGLAELVITSFGITMYEAFRLKTPVLLFNHTEYHWKLGRRLDVLNLGFFPDTSEEELKDRLREALDNRDELWKIAERNAGLVDGRGASRIVEVIGKAVYAQRKSCLFKHRESVAVKRSPGYSLMQCMRCKDLFIYDLEGSGRLYSDREYFLSEYKSRYGKTYIEDRPNIRLFAERRIKTIGKLVKVERGRLLDIGCALGFFLEVARDHGWEVTGVEISSFAANWARENLSLEVLTGSFLDFDFEPESFDVVTLFFVAEHFQNVEKLIEKVWQVLKKGGLVVLSIPNRGGISYRFNRKSYIEGHPGDHYFDTSVRNLVRFLRSYGFRKKRVVATGIHPERLLGKSGVERSKPLLKLICKAFMKILKVGDTFEYYGIKT
jgi:SAM-dependent methyltransferase